jgi:hypothetical protein
MSTLPLNQYQCEICRGIFEKGWSEEEARAEAKDKFGIEDKHINETKEAGIVCDDCFKKITNTFN